MKRAIKILKFMTVIVTLMTLVIPISSVSARLTENPSVKNDNPILGNSSEKRELLVQGGRNQQPDKEIKQSGWITYLFRTIRRVAVLLVLGIAIVLIFPGFLDSTMEKLSNHPLKSIGLGFAAFFLYPILVMILAGVFTLFILFAFWIGLSSLAGWLIVAGVANVLFLTMSYLLVITYLAKIIFGGWLGKIILSSANLSPKLLSVLSVSVGAVLIGALIAIPTAGWLIAFLIDLVGLGMIVMSMIKKNEHKRVEVDI